MKVSIALATYNGSKWIKDQLDSFNCQIKLPFELVVCDDCSTDDTVKIIEEYSRASKFPIVLHVNEKNIGYTRNFEKALSLCDGDLICLSDQDDVWEENKLLVITNCYRANPSFDVFVNDADYVDENLNLKGVTIVSKGISAGAGRYSNTAGACTTITKRFRDAVVPFPINNCPSHDTYIHRWSIILSNRYVIFDSLQKYRIHNTNTSSTELSNFYPVSPLGLYKKYKDINGCFFYTKKADEFSEMASVFLGREVDFLSLSKVVPRTKTYSILCEAVDAYKNRAMLCSLSWIRKKILIIRMVMKGHYRYFQGLRSLAKDLLR